MRTRRQQRYVILRRAGFCRFEAKPLSSVPIKTVPYMQGMIRERRELFRDALRQKVRIDQFEAEVKHSYNTKGFVKTDKVGRTVRDPWAFFRDYEDRYKDKYPSYESPGEKKRRIWNDFIAKMEKSITVQSRLRERMA